MANPQRKTLLLLNSREKYIPFVRPFVLDEFIFACIYTKYIYVSACTHKRVLYVHKSVYLFYILNPRIHKGATYTQISVRFIFTHIHACLTRVSACKLTQ